MSAITLMVCMKCGATAEVDTPGWLFAPLKDDQYKMIVRCPAHHTDDARLKAGLKRRYPKATGYAAQKKYAAKKRAEKNSASNQ